MSQDIIIIGGGISGLATLHYLKQKYAQRADVDILLLEKSAVPGGKIHSVVRGGRLFESGPNGFLDSKPRTLALVEELGLSAELVQAEEASNIRYVAIGDALHAFPMNPAGFFAFKPLGWQDKARVLGEIFVPKGHDPSESVHAFGARRFGKKFADIFLDPMVNGIYGGDAREVVLKAAFGRIYELEQTYGSLFRAMAALKKQKKNKEEGADGMPKGTLTSFRGGQGQLVEALTKRYPVHIRFNQEVKTVAFAQGQFTVRTAETRYEADELFISAPAYEAADMAREMSPAIASDLDKIRYAPMAVAGLVFPRRAFERQPSGFGYLIPSSEGKEVLGVLFESNIFPGRCGREEILLRIMIGGARYPDILSKSREALTALALREVQTTLKTGASPIETFFVQWPQAIPQYDRAYVEAERRLEEELKKWQGLYLVANYRKGVSLNDCVESAHQSARCSSL